MARFGQSSEPALREQVAMALVNKGVALGALNRNEEEIAAYEDVVARFGQSSEPALRESVARALINKNEVLERLSQKKRRARQRGGGGAIARRLMPLRLGVWVSG